MEHIAKLSLKDPPKKNTLKKYVLTQYCSIDAIELVCTMLYQFQERLTIFWFVMKSAYFYCAIISTLSYWLGWFLMTFVKLIISTLTVCLQNILRELIFTNDVFHECC